MTSFFHATRPRHIKKQGIASGVARAPKKGGCWAQVYVYAGDDWPTLAVCGNPARKGFLTCVKHQDREAAAQKSASRELDLALR